MIDLSSLEDRFRSFDLSPLNAFRDQFGGGEVFTPYVPWVGSEYIEGGILLYGTAQNLKKGAVEKGKFRENRERLIRRLYYQPWNDWVPGKHFQDVSINPYSTGILPALAGIVIYLLTGEQLRNLDDIHNRVAITNYYKFSLRQNERRDQNPNNLPEGVFKQDYLRINDELCKEEVLLLRPSIVITFKNNPARVFEDARNLLGFNSLKVNDPAWLLRGGGPCFREGRGWCLKAASVNDQTIRQLIQNWCSQIPDGDWAKGYKSKARMVEIYLLSYYLDWLSELKPVRSVCK